MVAAAKKASYYKLVPKDRLGNLAFRAAVYRRAATDPQFAAAMRQACAEDPLFWINVFVWTYDPRRRPHSKIPMITYRFQDRAIRRLIRAIQRGHDILLEKSRDMGASWVCSLAIKWFWMFRHLQSFLLGSRVEQYVDKRGNPKSLFWKLDFVLEHMPPWLRPNFIRQKMHLLNVDNGSVIDGESTTEEFARGDRRTAVLLDEFAAVEQGHGVLSATRDVTNCRIINSTHRGTGTAYYRISRTKIAKLRMHWSEHPRKAVGLYTKRGERYVFIDSLYWSRFDDPEAVARDLDERILNRGVPLEDGKLRSPWYARQCERAAHAVEIAQELDIDCLGSSFQFFSAPAIENYIQRHCRVPYHIGDIEFDAETLQPTGWRENPRGRFHLWMQLDGRGFPVNRGIHLGCDVSAGTGASNSAMSGISRISFEKVLEYANPHIRPEAFGQLAVVVARWLGNAFVIWEQNGPGRQFGDAVIEAGYRHVYMRRDSEEKVVKRMTHVPGWVPTKDNKLKVLGDYRRAIELEMLVNYSEPALRDCLEYVYLPNGSIVHSGSEDKVDPSGAHSNHGDRTIADALAWKAAKDQPMPKAVDRPSVPQGSPLDRRRRAKLAAGRKTAWN